MLDNSNETILDGEKAEHTRIRKNASWLFAGQIIGRTVRTLLLIYAARVLGVAGWGIFSYALSIATFFTIFSDIGINATITREISKNPEQKKSYISTAFYIKLTIISVVVFVSVFLAGFITNVKEVALIMPLAALMVGFDALRDLGSAIARAMEKMKIEGINNIVTNSVIAGSGFFILLNYPNSFNLMWAYVLGTGVGFLLIFFTLRNQVIGVFAHFNSKLARKIISTSWPMGLVGLMGIIMVNTDIVMIGWLRSVEEVGLYSAGQKVVQLLYLVPTLLASAFFPMLAKSAEDTGKFRSLFEQALSMIFMVAIPLSAGGIILGEPIINLLYGEDYAAAVPSFMILMLSIVAVFPAVLMANAIFAHNKHKSFLIYALGGILGNIVFNFALIPVWGIVGSAVATLVNQTLINAYFWTKLKNINDFKIIGRLKKIILSALVMGIISLALLGLGAHVLINVSISGMLYFGMLYLLKDSSLYRFIGSDRK